LRKSGLKSFNTSQHVLGFEKLRIKQQKLRRIETTGNVL